MSELGWGDVRKQAVPVDEESDVFVAEPMYMGMPTDAPPTRVPRHADEPERANFEARLYAFLVDNGWEDRGMSECVMRDEWTHPESPYSGMSGADLALLLDFDLRRLLETGEAVDVDVLDLG